MKIGPRLVKRKVGTSLPGVFAFLRAHVARREIFCLHYCFYSSPLWPYRGALPCTSRLPPYFYISPGCDASTKRREKETIKKVRRQGGSLLREHESFLAGPLARGGFRENIPSSRRVCAALRGAAKRLSKSLFFASHRSCARPSRGGQLQAPARRSFYSY